MMTMLDSIKDFFDQLDEKRFYQYTAGVLGGVFLFLLVLFFFYYRSVSSLHEQISDLNAQRQEVQKIVAQAQRVNFQKQEVNQLLAQEPNFKIKGYFETLLNELGLSRKVASEIQVTTAIGEGSYDEKVLTLQLADMTMKELTTLLDTIEEKRRVYTKELEINRSKTPNRIDATLVIGTLEPKE